MTSAAATQQNAGAAAPRAHAFLERLVDALPTPVFVKGRDHRFIFVNDALCALLGQPHEALIGKSDADFLPAAQADLFAQMDDVVFATRREHLNEEEIQDATGKLRTIVTRKSVFPGLDGEDVLVGVINDVTESKRTQEMLALGAQVFEHAAEGMFISDADNTILRVNPAFCRITGYSADEVVNRKPSILSSGKQSRSFYEHMWQTLLAEGCWEGELVNRRKDGELYPEWLKLSVVRDDAGRISHHIAMFSDFTQRKRAEERVQFLAQHDVLTSLPNRSLLFDRVEQALLRSTRANMSTALMMLDLDDFKTVNDTLGHHAGDTLLREVARRLTSCVRKSDSVARLGGDEFVVLIAETNAADDAKLVARKILAEMARPFVLEGRELRIGVSIGIGVFPQDGADATALLHAADRAMYQVKRTIRNDFSFAASLGLAA